MRPFWFSHKEYLRQRFGTDVYRLGVDGGFSCPNRGTDRSLDGCTFCSGTGARSPYTSGAADLEAQVTQGKAFLTERYGALDFSLYFQAYSSTWAPLAELKSLYDRALTLGPFKELVVSTRPDCLDGAVADLLAGYQNPDQDVWVELGLQSSNDHTLKRIRRGHDAQSFAQACAILGQRKIPTTAHLIYGLPGEGLGDFLTSVRFALDCGVQAFKFHNLLIPPGTAMADEEKQGLARMPSMEAYLEAVAQALTEIPRDLVIMRLTSDYEGREDELASEVWPKNRFYQRLEKLMRERSWAQGGKEVRKA